MKLIFYYMPVISHLRVKRIDASARAFTTSKSIRRAEHDIGIYFPESFEIDQD